MDGGRDDAGGGASSHGVGQDLSDGGEFSGHGSRSSTGRDDGSDIRGSTRSSSTGGGWQRRGSDQGHRCGHRRRGRRRRSDGGSRRLQRSRDDPDRGNAHGRSRGIVVPGMELMVAMAKVMGFTNSGEGSQKGHGDLGNELHVDGCAIFLVFSWNGVKPWICMYWI